MGLWRSDMAHDDKHNTLEQRTLSPSCHSMLGFPAQLILIPIEAEQDRTRNMPDTDGQKKKRKRKSMYKLWYIDRRYQEKEKKGEKRELQTASVVDCSGDYSSNPAMCAVSMYSMVYKQKLNIATY